MVSSHSAFCICSGWAACLVWRNKHDCTWVGKKGEKKSNVMFQRSTSFLFYFSNKKQKVRGRNLLNCLLRLGARGALADKHSPSPSRAISFVLIACIIWTLCMKSSHALPKPSPSPALFAFISIVLVFHSTYMWDPIRRRYAQRIFRDLSISI